MKNVGASPAPVEIKRRAPRIDAMPTQVVALLQKSPQPLNAEQVTQALDKPLPSIRKVLQKLFAEGKIERAERGKYRAKQDMKAVASKAA